MLRYDYVRLKPEKQLGWHSHPNWELAYVIRGKGRRVIGDSEDFFEEGDLVLVVPNMPHVWYFDTSFDYIENISIRFNPELISLTCNAYPEFQNVCNYLSGLKDSINISGKCKERIIRLMFEMNESSELEKIFIGLQILSIISRQEDIHICGQFSNENAAQKKIKDVTIYVSCNFMHNITLDEIAQHIGMSKARFCSFWKKETGETFFSFLIRNRIKVACYLLSKPESQISTVCYECGFSDLPNFSKTFKKIIGVSPREYRKQMLEGISK